jgi:hypothetical protein
MKWSKWISFKTFKQDSLPQQSGVYIIRFVEEKRIPAGIARANGVDKEGTLSIGETADLRHRLAGFYRTVYSGATRSNHSASWYYVSFKYSRLYPKKGLQFKFFQTATKAGAEREEFRLLTRYRTRFLDLPPLNNMPGKYPRNWKTIMERITRKPPLKE